MRAHQSADFDVWVRQQHDDARGLIWGHKFVRGVQVQKRLHQGAHNFCILKQLRKIERLHETQQ